MTVLLAALRWLGLRGIVALLALSFAGVQTLRIGNLKRSLALSQAHYAVIAAQRDAAAELASEYQTRAAQAVADLAASEKARKAADAARKSKWQRIRESEPAWSEQRVPEAVVEALR